MVLISVRTKLDLQQIIPMENTVLTSIANQFESPIYVYDADKMEHQYKRLTEAFQNVPQLRINYAVKALSNVNIL
mgnify:CR=1